MNYDLKKILPAFVISLALIRFWIEIVTTIIFKNSSLINQVNNNRVGFHHWQLGLVIIIFALVFGKLSAKSNIYINLALGSGLALFLNQYVYVLRLTGINLPFEYRSQIDYLIIYIFIIGLISFWVYLGKR